MDPDFGRWSASDKSVCWRCLHNDEYLISIIREEGSDETICSYCSEAGATSLDTLLELVDNYADSGYEHADSHPGVYSSADGGYQFPTYDLWDVQQDFLGDYVEDGELMMDILESFEASTLAKAIYDEDMLGTPWERFSHFVKRRSRYMFWTNSETLSSGDHHWYGDAPLRVLEDLGERLSSRGLIRTLSDTEIWRAQGHRGAEIEGGATATRLGTVPEEFAFSPNRMSAPGIPMFYGSLSDHTAVVETTRHGDPMWDHATVAAFRPSRDLVVLDLTNISVPPMPSLFRADDDPVVTEHNDAAFLQNFVETVSQAIPDAQASYGIEYVPTQVFTEFVLHAMRGAADGTSQIDGILYPSAEVAGSINVVLDVPNRSCVDEVSTYAREGHQLELVLDRATTRVAKREWTVPPPELDKPR